MVKKVVSGQGYFVVQKPLGMVVWEGGGAHKVSTIFLTVFNHYPGSYIGLLAKFACLQLKVKSTSLCCDH